MDNGDVEVRFLCRWRKNRPGDIGFVKKKNVKWMQNKKIIGDVCTNGMSPDAYRQWGWLEDEETWNKKTNNKKLKTELVTKKDEDNEELSEHTEIEASETINEVDE